MDPIEFFVPATPIAQPRQRIGTRIVRGKRVPRAYRDDSHPVHEFKRAVRYWGKPKFPKPLDGPLAVDLLLIFPRPKSLTRKSNRLQPKETKPDWDNVGKAVCDALNGIAWLDDAQVSDGRVRKRIAGDGDFIGVKVQVREDKGHDES